MKKQQFKSFQNQRICKKSVFNIAGGRKSHKSTDEAPMPPITDPLEDPEEG